MGSQQKEQPKERNDKACCLEMQVLMRFKRLCVSSSVDKIKAGEKEVEVAKDFARLKGLNVAVIDLKTIQHCENWGGGK